MASLHVQLTHVKYKGQTRMVDDVAVKIWTIQRAAVWIGPEAFQLFKENQI